MDPWNIHDIPGITWARKNPQQIFQLYPQVKGQFLLTWEVPINNWVTDQIILIRKWLPYVFLIYPMFLHIFLMDIYHNLAVKEENTDGDIKASL